VNRPVEGDPVPAFSMTADDGSEVSDESLTGHRYVLYFYPKDDTPGCTAQACSLRDNWDRVTDAGIEVFGVSPDSVRRHVKFRLKYDLPYRLLADEGHAIAERFGVWIEKSFAGKHYMGTERTSFLVGEDGHIDRVFPQVKPLEHVDLLLGALV
jgi:peroxiredoxin Q/BCP